MALIETQQLTKRYGETVLALNGLDLVVEPGITGLVGANGAGKSTLIKILLGLLEPTSGEATVLGYEIAREGPVLRQYVGYMPEHDCLPGDVSATEFVAHMAQINGLPRAAARERTAETLRHVGLFEERYREMRGYSTGMKQRVKLAQALVHDPRVLFLDEPTNGLDPAGRDEMLDLVRRTGKEFGISIIMASHLLGEIERVCEYLVVIDGGQLLQQGPLGDFTAAMGVLAVEVEGEAAVLAGNLRERGLRVEVEGRMVLVALEGDERAFDLIRDSCADLGFGLVRLERRRQNLEDLFRPTEKGTAHAAS
ncbi:MAG: ABC transporter ATP-binding protein [Chloroflexi bacterium]|nr:ABC transporter ATP-binding protein [Dehalococcoidia bacterium]MCO5202565.1 ABC transporter ATP-binding protein [Chloroflexota bacterium]PWB47035.1 MAG: ABC transporter [Dehalococcoidia bacterium]